MSSAPFIKAIIFDLGNVLIGYDEPQGMRKLIGKIQDTDGKAIMDPVAISAFLNAPDKNGKSPWSDMQHGIVKQSAVPLLMQQRAGDAVSPELLEESFCDVFYALLERQNILHALLQENKMQIVVLSDTVPLHINRINSHFPELLAPLPAQSLFYSYDLGTMKKEGSMSYEFVANKLEIASENILMLDDSMANKKGAEDIGMHFQLVQPQEDLAAILFNNWNIKIPSYKEGI